jgi:hypothetical protein
MHSQNVRKDNQVVVPNPLWEDEASAGLDDEDNNTNRLEDWISTHDRQAPPSRSPSGDDSKKPTSSSHLAPVTGAQWASSEQVRPGPKQTNSSGSKTAGVSEKQGRPQYDNGASGLLLALEQTTKRIERIGSEKSSSKPKRGSDDAALAPAAPAAEVADGSASPDNPSRESESLYLWPADMEARRESRGRRASGGAISAPVAVGAKAFGYPDVGNDTSDVYSAGSDTPSKGLAAERISSKSAVAGNSDTTTVTPPKAFAVGHDYRAMPPDTSSSSAEHLVSEGGAAIGTAAQGVSRAQRASSKKRRAASGTAVKSASVLGAQGSKHVHEDEEDEEDGEEDEDEDEDEDEEDEDEEEDDDEDDEEDDDDEDDKGATAAVVFAQAAVAKAAAASKAAASAAVKDDEDDEEEEDEDDEEVV